MIFTDIEKKIGVELVSKFFAKHTREELIALNDEFEEAKRTIFGSIFYEQASVGGLGEASQKIFDENSIVRLSSVLNKYLEHTKK
jgi:hypothetical protein